MQAEACNFIKKETQAQVFSCEFCKISKYTFSTEHVWAAACYLFISFIQKVIFLTRHGFAPRKIIGKTIMFGCFPLEEFFYRRHSKWPYVNMIQKQLLRSCLHCIVKIIEMSQNSYWIGLLFKFGTLYSAHRSS